jgi:citrate synthase
MEQYSDTELVRPRAAYVGRLPGSPRPSTE